METDVNPNNILLSDLEPPVPIVKLGDLDNGMLLNDKALDLFCYSP